MKLPITYGVLKDTRLATTLGGKHFTEELANLHCIRPATFAAVYLYSQVTDIGAQGLNNTTTVCLEHLAVQIVRPRYRIGIGAESEDVSVM